MNALDFATAWRRVALIFVATCGALLNVYMPHLSADEYLAINYIPSYTAAIYRIRVFDSSGIYVRECLTF